MSCNFESRNPATYCYCGKCGSMHDFGPCPVPMEPAMPQWACIDCYMLHCNGETDPNMTEEETADFLARYQRGTEGYEVTAGMFARYHDCTDDDDTIADECECDQIDFRMSPCDICNSHLGGSRHALTLWLARS
jgi:hypothetical protein